MAPEEKYQDIPLAEDEIDFTTANAPLHQPAAPMTEITTSEIDVEAHSIEDKDFVQYDQNGDIPSGTEYGAVTKNNSVNRRGSKVDKRRLFSAIALIVIGASLITGAVIPLFFYREDTPVPSREVSLTDTADNVFDHTEEYIPAEPVSSKNDQNIFANTSSRAPKKEAVDIFGSSP
jgi:hypothetical protein